MSPQFSDDIIKEAVDKALNALGSTPKAALWAYLEQVSGFTQNNFPQNIDGFQDTLQKFFGVGFEFLNILLCQNLSSLTQQEIEGHLSFARLVKSLRKGNITEITNVECAPTYAQSLLQI